MKEHDLSASDKLETAKAFEKMEKEKPLSRQVRRRHKEELKKN